MHKRTHGQVSIEFVIVAVLFLLFSASAFVYATEFSKTENQKQIYNQVRRIGIQLADAAEREPLYNCTNCLTYTPPLIVDTSKLTPQSCTIRINDAATDNLVVAYPNPVPANPDIEYRTNLATQNLNFNGAPTLNGTCGQTLTLK